MEILRIEEINKRQESLEKRKKERQMEMKKFLSEKIQQNQKKEEIVYKNNTQLSMFKEEFDRRLNEKGKNIQERVCLFFYKTNKGFL